MLKKLLISLASICFLIGLGVYIQGSFTNTKSETSSLETVWGEDISLSIVSIIEESKMDIYRSDPYNFFENIVGQIEVKSGQGKGFFVSDDGLIITNKHVINKENAKYTVILPDGSEYLSQIVYIDKQKDIALLQIDTDSTKVRPLDIQGEENIIHIGDPILTVGNPLTQNTRHGNIVNLGEEINENNYTQEWLLQTDITLYSGDSGSPLIGNDGKVIGINTAYDISKSNTSYAIEITAEMIEKFFK
ncbi:serine protease [Candidatus Gracilibacteria bacterium]|nr:serine protease [Candidatus Gracilibacteria bacterium]